MSENCNYAPVEKVILIDDRRIEIYWGEQMRRADNENDYLVKYKGEVQELRLTHCSQTSTKKEAKFRSS